MKKIVMSVMGVAMAVVLTGCGGSPKDIAEEFATALVQGESEAAFNCFDVDDYRSKERKDVIDDIEDLKKKIGDDKLGAETIYECIELEDEDKGYKIVDGKKILGFATVVEQFVKGEDKKSFGMKVDFIKKDGDWFVISFRYLEDVEMALPRIASRKAEDDDD